MMESFYERTRLSANLSKCSDLVDGQVPPTRDAHQVLQSYTILGGDNSGTTIDTYFIREHQTDSSN